MARTAPARCLRVLGWISLACLALPAAATTPAPDAWAAHPYPAMAGNGCVKTTWAGGVVYAVRTPSCSLAAGQDVTFERYVPATGASFVIAHLPGSAAEAGPQLIGSHIYIFTPQHPGIAPFPVQRYDPSSGILQAMGSYFPGCQVDAPSFTVGETVTWTSNCVWSCQFIRYDAAMDTWTTLQAKLPGEPGQLSKLGVLWDGNVAHILTYDAQSHVTRFYDYTPANDAVVAGAVADIGSVAGPLLQSGPAGGVIATWAGSLSIRMTRFDLATGGWTVEPGIMTGLHAGPALWAADVAWGFDGSGAVTCETRVVACPTDPPTEKPVDKQPIIITDPDPRTPTTPPENNARPGEPDGDSDGIPDSADNCPNYANREQGDRDQDSFGDACDSDMDGDGIENLADNCPLASNPAQEDADANLVGDACEPHIATTPTDPRAGTGTNDAIDHDLDGIADTSDNCPAIQNPKQEDLDRDGMGDVCDADRDGDGVVQVSIKGAYLDNCPDTPNADQTDVDQNGVGDACSVVALPYGHGTGPLPPSNPGTLQTFSAPQTGTFWTPLSTAGLGVVAVGVVAGLWAANKKWLPFLAPLFTRFINRDVSAHPARARLLAAIEAQPGIHFNELSRLAAQARGSVRHHLQVLETAGLVRTVRSGRYSCLYLADVPTEPGAGMRKSEVARRLESIVRDHPGTTAAEASRTLGVTYGAAAYHMRRMAEAGLVRLEDKPLAAYPVVQPHAPQAPPAMQH